MRKNSIAIISLAFLASCFMVSCSTEAFDTNQPVKGAKIVIPAQKMSTKAVDAEGKATFLFSENVYIANSGGTIDANAIHPSAESASTTFTGTLSGTYFQGEKITVLYNTNKSGVVDYSGQDGSIGSVKDAGYAEDIEIVSYSEDVLTTKPAKIKNLQSIFKFTFTNGSTDTVISGIRFVRVFSTKNKLVSSYDAKSKSNNTLGPVTISRSTNLDDNYIYAALRFDSNDGDEIVFQVIDKDGKVYSGSKPAPKDGFEIGKFYESTVTVNLYTFTVSSGKQVCFSPGDLGVDNGVYSFTEPFADWAQFNTSTTAPSKRVWFDMYNDSNLATNEVYGIKAWRNPIKTNNSYYEWVYLVTDRSMKEAGVNRFYRVIIPGHQYCLLLPPDETVLTSGEKTELEGGNLGDDYVKYLGKGFVLLCNTGTAIYGTKGPWKWNSSFGTTSFSANQGYYWAQFTTSNRIYFTWSDSVPYVSSTSTRMRNHIRYVHDI